MHRLYRSEGLTAKERRLLQTAGISPGSVEAETCFVVEAHPPLDSTALEKVLHLLGAHYGQSALRAGDIIEIGPRLTFETPLSSTLRGVCHDIGLLMVGRIERVRRYRFDLPLSKAARIAVTAVLHDAMTQSVYRQPLTSFATDHRPEPVQTIPVHKMGIAALKRADQTLLGGLGMTPGTIAWMQCLFTEGLQRDPTDCEVAALAQANSEHCRHHMMRSSVSLDGIVVPSLFELFRQTLAHDRGTSIIAFHDDASAIRGWKVPILVIDPATHDFKIVRVVVHPTNTAETHSGPSEVAPYPGAATGPGGRMRDSICPGRGGILGAGGMGICVAALLIPGHDLPWEDGGGLPRAGLPSALQVLVEGSDGAFDYANCLGEPCIVGHAATFDLVLPEGRRAWRKPILYTSGSGLVRNEHVAAEPPQEGMVAVQIGGPAYPIGLGGGSFSSRAPGSGVSEGDLAAVQRPDPAKQRGLYNVFRRCIERGPDNPILAAHDLGAGGDANALPEVVDAAGGRFNVRWLPIGDTGMTVLQIFVCEAQERNVVLVRQSDLPVLWEIARRESTTAAVVGEVTGDGMVVLFDSDAPKDAPEHVRTPVNLPVTAFDGTGVAETVAFNHVPRTRTPLVLPHKLSVWEALSRVFRLMTVGSKHFLVDKADRSVTGQVAQQQCVGPFHTPLSGYGIVAHSMTANKGTVKVQGERHRTGFVSTEAQARMAIVEVVQKLMAVVISGLSEVRFSGNWMWPPLLEDGNGWRLYRAAQAMVEACLELGLGEDGGKDSIFMRSFDNTGNKVVSPEQLVLDVYATVPDVRARVTPELKEEGNTLILVDLSEAQARLGGSALAQVYSQVGDDCPDLTNFDLLGRAFTAVQELVRRQEVVALHGRGDGGLVTTLIEMSIAGGLGICANIRGNHDTIAALFNEEAGVVIEVRDQVSALQFLRRRGVPHAVIGTVTGRNDPVRITYNGTQVLARQQHTLRALWSETSSHIDEAQSAPEPIRVERELMSRPLQWPDWRLTYEPAPTRPCRDKFQLAVLRCPGTNGEYEMAQAAMAAGFHAVDVTVTDLMDGLSLDRFRGILLPGGFGYRDIPDAGRALAAVMMLNENVAATVARFRNRPDTFGFGVCNGAQAMLRLGWAPFPRLPDERRPVFARNRVERHKSSWVTVEVLPSPSILFKGMVGSRLGTWVSHGEGRLSTPDRTVMDLLQTKQLVPLRYVTPGGDPAGADNYPYNPSGTPFGWLSVCSEDGRYTAIMSHPERTANQPWQWPWLPPSWRSLPVSPWLRPFQNAYNWCHKTAA